MQIFLAFTILSICTAVSFPKEILDQSSVLYFSNSIEPELSCVVFHNIPHYTRNRNYGVYNNYFLPTKVKPPEQIIFFMEHTSDFKQDLRIVDVIIDSFHLEIVPLLIAFPNDPENLDKTQISNLQENLKLVGQGRVPMILILESTFFYFCHNCFHKQGLQTRQYNRGIHSG